MNIADGHVTLRPDFHPPSSQSRRVDESLSLDQWLVGSRAETLTEPDKYLAASEVWDDVLLKPARMFLRTPGKGLRRRFVELGWSLAWREAHQTPLHRDVTPPSCPSQLIVLIELLHAGSLIIDDIEDDSETRRGEPCLHRRIGLAPALNVGNWLYFASASLIEELDCGQLIKGHLHRALNRVMLRCHQGQALAVSLRVSDVPRDKVYGLVDTSTRLKSGVLIGFATQLGSLYLGQPPKVADSLYAFGEQLGRSLQMYDDLSGIIKDRRWNKGREDLTHHRLTWVWAWLSQDSKISEDQYKEFVISLRSLKDHQRGNEALLTTQLEELRTRLTQAVGHAVEHIIQSLDHAITQLAEQLTHPQIEDLATQSIMELKRSYL